jgi:cytochrome c-type biogenesis protein CcmH
MKPRVALAIAGLVLALGALPARAATGQPVDENTVHQIAVQLRCVVCQNLSVGDSPSETANQMRGLIREQLAAGRTPDEVLTYFVERYGQWILLSPPKQGFNLLVWVVPFAGLALGLVGVALVLRRWARNTRAAPPAPDVEDAMRERIRRELAELDRR